MRGTIEVGGSVTQTGPSLSEVKQTPLYVLLSLDIYAPHETPVVADIPPSSARGHQWANRLEAVAINTTDFYRANSPYQAFERLGTTSLTDAEKSDAVSFIWMSNTTPAQLGNGERLYAQNCAACHGRG